MNARQITNEFAKYIIENNKTKLSMDELYKEFVDTGYFDKCKNALPEHLSPILEYWDDNSWKIYIWNYVKLQVDYCKLLEKVKEIENEEQRNS